MPQTTSNIFKAITWSLNGIVSPPTYHTTHRNTHKVNTCHMHSMFSILYTLFVINVAKMDITDSQHLRNIRIAIIHGLFVFLSLSQQTWPTTVDIPSKFGKQTLSLSQQIPPTITVVHTHTRIRWQISVYQWHCLQESFYCILMIKW